MTSLKNLLILCDLFIMIHFWVWLLYLSVFVTYSHCDDVLVFPGYWW